MKKRHRITGVRGEVAAEPPVVPVTAELMTATTLDLLPLGFEGALRWLKSVEPELHRGIENGASEAIAMLKDESLSADLQRRLCAGGESESCAGRGHCRRTCGRHGDYPKALLP